MIPSFPASMFPIVQHKVAAMFELAVDVLGHPMNEFAALFASSSIGHGFESGDPIVVFGKSANELVGLLLGEEPLDQELNEEGSPEYWVGYVLSLAQWRLNRPYKELMEAIPCDELLFSYFPYHEMDPERVVELFRKRMNLKCPLAFYREKRGWSQSDLALISEVPIRVIRAYEQGSVDIAKAHGDTLFALAKALGCHIEDLIR